MGRCITILPLLVLVCCSGEPPSESLPPPDPVATPSSSLRSEIPEERDAALEEYAALGPEGAAAVPDLLFLIRGADESVREAARAVLRGMGDAAIPELLAAMSGEDWQDRAPAVRCLVELGPAAGRRILPLLADPSCRRGAIDYLLLCDPLPEMVPGHLAGALAGADPVVRRNAITVLAKIDAPPEEVMPFLFQLAEDPDTTVLGGLIGALEKTSPDHAGPVLVRLLEHGDSWIRLKAVYALGRCARSATPEMVAAVMQVTRDPDDRVRGAAMGWIMRLGPRDTAALDLLLEGLSDEETMVRIACIQALQGLGPKAAPAGPALVAHLDHADDRLVAAAARAVAVLEIELTAEQAWLAFRHLRGSLRDEDYLQGILLDAGREDPEVLVRMMDLLLQQRRITGIQSFVSSLVEIGAPADPLVPQVVQALVDLRAVTDSAAARYFRGSGPTARRGAIPLLHAALSTAGPVSRLQILHVLLLLSADEGKLMPALIAALSDENDETVECALEVIDLLGSQAEPALPALKKLAAGPAGERSAEAAAELVKRLSDGR